MAEKELDYEDILMLKARWLDAKRRSLKLENEYLDALGAWRRQGRLWPDEVDPESAVGAVVEELTKLKELGATVTVTKGGAGDE